MRFAELEAEWDEDNLEHIARHGVEPEEVEEIVYEDCHRSWIVRAPSGRPRGALGCLRPDVRRSLLGCCHCSLSAARGMARGNRDGHGKANPTEVPAVAQKL